MLLMDSGSSPRCFFQLRAQIQTVVEVFVSKLGFEGKRDGGAHGRCPGGGPGHYGFPPPDGGAVR